MTRKILLIASVAGIALTSPVSAEKGSRSADNMQQAAAQQGGGKKAERPQRQERPQQVQRAERQQTERVERPQRVERQQMQRAERPQRVERQVQRAERQQQRVERPQRVERQQQRAERQAQRVERNAKVDRQQQRVERQAQRIERNAKVDRQQQRVERQAQRIERNNVRPQQLDRQQQRIERKTAERLFAPRGDDRSSVRTARFDGRGYRPVAPVFSTRDMRQMTPFKAKFDDRQIVTIGDRVDFNSQAWSPVPTYFANNYVDTSDYYHRYDSDFGSVYRIDRNDGFVRSQFPLFGGYGIGDPWPQSYYSSYVPSGYRDYYYDTPDYFYRNDGYGIYQVDSSTQLITALVSLVMGQGYGVGQALPASYGVYNVPLDYRANYYDTDDSSYRYGDGFIYQVDPDSRRVAARYPLYSDNYYVGEQWPGAYPDYNVPYGYRSAYADTPQYHYRYANDGIYQVDPTNQMILSLVALLSGDQFAVGQSMPGGYDIYNVPVDYRDRYADSDNEYYRYANGQVYRVDAGSGLIEEAYPVYG